MSTYRKFTPPASRPENEVSGGTAAKVANAAKVTAPPRQTLAGLAGLAGVPLKTENPSEAGDWEFDSPPLGEAFRENISRRCQMGYRESEAARWAYGAALDDWHRQHGARPLPGSCAGCGAPLCAGDNLHNLADGARVHATGHDCLIAYGRTWRGAARAALTGLGIEPPAGWSDVDDGDSKR